MIITHENAILQGFRHGGDFCDILEVTVHMKAKGHMDDPFRAEASNEGGANDASCGSEARMRALLDALPDVMCVISEGGAILECHGQDQSGMFLSTARTDCARLDDGFPPEIAGLAMEAVREAMRSHNAYVSEVEVAAETGNVKFFEFRCSRCSPGEVLLIIRDITKQKEFERTLTQLFEEVSHAKAEWEITFNSVSEFIILTDDRYRILRCNQSFGAFMEKQPVALVGKDLAELLQIAPKDRAKHLVQLSEGRPVSHSWLDARNRWLYMSEYPIQDPQGALEKIVVTVSDVTDLMTVQKELMRSDKELKERVEELERFYNMVIGRELKMRELKKRNAELEHEIEMLKTGPLDL